MSRKRGRARSLRLPVRTMEREGWGVALEVGGVTQSVSVPEGVAPPDDAPDDAPDGAREPKPGPGGGYWGLMLPVTCPRRALLLGLGGGTIAHLLAWRCPGVAIVGIERDVEVLAVARTDFGLDAIPHLEVVEADAFSWVSEHSDTAPGSFDLVCLDLFEAGRLTLGTLATPFLRQVGALLAPNGVLTVNLMVTGRTPEQVHRLERVFTIQRQLRLRGNLVVHGTPAVAGVDAHVG